MLKVSNLQKTFRGGDGQPVHAVDDVSFEVKDGVFASIIGKSGSGKSTLLSMLGALDKPTAGTIEVGGQDVSKIWVKSSASIVVRRSALCFKTTS